MKEEKEMIKEDWNNGDELICRKCDRFVSTLNNNRECPECSCDIEENFIEVGNEY